MIVIEGLRNIAGLYDGAGALQGLKYMAKFLGSDGEAITLPMRQDSVKYEDPYHVVGSGVSV